MHNDQFCLPTFSPKVCYFTIAFKSPNSLQKVTSNTGVNTVTRKLSLVKAVIHKETYRKNKRTKFQNTADQRNRHPKASNYQMPVGPYLHIIQGKTTWVIFQETTTLIWENLCVSNNKHKKKCLPLHNVFVPNNIQENQSIYTSLGNRLMFWVLKTFILLLWYFSPRILWDEGPQVSWRKNTQIWYAPIFVTLRSMLVYTLNTSGGKKKNKILVYYFSASKFLVSWNMLQQAREHKEFSRTKKKKQNIPN